MSRLINPPYAVNRAGKSASLINQTPPEREVMNGEKDTRAAPRGRAHVDPGGEYDG